MKMKLTLSVIIMQHLVTNELTLSGALIQSATWNSKCNLLICMISIVFVLL